jgi:inner membrane protein
MIVVHDDRQYRLAYVRLTRREPPAAPAPDTLWLFKVASSYRPADALSWQTVPRFGASVMEADLATQVWHAEFFARFRRFALYPAVYRIDHTPARTCVWFNDLRFALFGRDMPFRYGACRPNVASPWQVYRLLGDGADEALDLVHRR